MRGQDPVKQAQKLGGWARDPLPEPLGLCCPEGRDPLKAAPPRLLPGSVFAISDSFLEKGSPNYLSFSPLPLHPVISLQPPSLLIQRPGSSSSPQMLCSLGGRPPPRRLETSDQGP